MTDSMIIFDTKWTLDTATGCHLWQKGFFHSGYGYYRVDGKLRRAHRWAYQQYHKLTDEQMPPEVCHACDTPACVREQCLFPGTHAENMADCAAKGRIKVPHGSESPNTKLVEADVIAIRASELNQYQLSDKYGISQSSVWRILHRKTWAHV